MGSKLIENLYNGFHTVDKVEVEVKGKSRIIERLGIKNAVGAIVTDAEGKIGLVKQFRPCISEVMYEIPAGLMDKEGLTNKEVIIEELEEECEINRTNISYISSESVHTYYMICGSSNAEIALYRVKLSSIEESKLVKDADVESVAWLSMQEFEVLIQNTKIKDAKTLMAYFILKNEIK